MPEYFELRHRIGFEETNIVGNVYYANYVRWQGRAREMFLLEHAPDTLARIKEGLKLFTVSVGCEFYSELTAFDEIAVRMSLQELRQTQVRMGFDYVHLLPDGEERLAARGHQHIAFMFGPNGRTEPVAVPQDLVEGLRGYDLARAAR